MRAALLLILAVSAAQAGEVREGPAAYGDWRSDAPGVVRLITPASMPAPFATTSAAHAPSLVARPASARLSVPPGFAVSEYASGLDRPRTLRAAPNGDVFVAESGASRLRVLRAADGAERPAQSSVFATDLPQPFGMAFWPPGPNPRFLYVALSSRVVRLPYESGDLRARGPAEVVVPHLPTGGHWTRDVVFSPDGRVMFVSIGSASNVGVADEKDRADVLAFDPDGSHARIYASGLRNCTAEAIHPATGGLWCVVNERDGLGDNLPPDYATSVREGAFYGWPWYYIGDHPDPRLKGQRSELAGRITVPDVLFQPHSAPLGIIFYDGWQFPPEYRGDAFVAFRGSWNREHRTGYKVVRVRFANGRPTGEYEDFLTGFVASDQAVWGRPVGAAVAHDGALLVSEDGNGTIWRVAYTGTNR
ncbi:MAG TPA: sorbosone dehydrogenase family protein [Acetobacteraceae bacterium]|jgi:glucose/arabinose dehydrogenase